MNDKKELGVGLFIHQPLINYKNKKRINMALIRKMIRYPDEYKAMGILQGGTDLTMGTQPASEESIKNAIIDISNFFINDLKMIRVPVDGEIDLENIPDLDIATKSTQFNNMNQLQSLSYGFIKLAFNDEYQDAIPLFLKLTFEMKNIAFKINNAVQKNRFAFVVRCDIIGENEVVYHTLIPCNLEYHTNYDYADQQYYHKDEVVVDSIGFNNGSELFVNIYPQRYVCCGATRNATYFPKNLSNYICFYIERNDKFIKIVQLSGVVGGVYSTLSSVKSVNTNTTYIPYNPNLKLNTTDNVFMPYLGRKILNVYKASIATTDINPDDNRIYKSDNVLVCYTEDVETDVVEVQEGEVATQYYVYKPVSGKSIRYIRDQRISLMFRVNND